MTPLYTTAQIRAIEQATGTAGLMEKAGLATAMLARDMLGDSGISVLVVAGPGNNGGDALVAARHLKAWWFRVAVVFVGDRDRLPPDALAAHDAWLAVDGRLENEIPTEDFDLVIDGLFGIGLSRPLQGLHAGLVERIAALALPVLAIDIPSGLCADTGRVLDTAVHADCTVTFLGLKPGLFTLEGPDHAGEIVACDLGISSEAYADPQGWLIDQPPARLLPRSANAHKGSFGSAAILGGDNSMVGAALLAGRAALLAGAGRVYVGLMAEHALAVDPMQPELMLRSAKALLDLPHPDIMVVGPGLGRSEHAMSALRRIMHIPSTLLLDADALHLLAGNVDFCTELRARSAACILTPHPGEAAALLECSIAEVQADRIAAACEIARRYQAIAVLKGCGSIVAAPDGRWFVNRSGNPGMGSAGMGDVLCGIIAALVAQGMQAEPATLLGIYLHGAAADRLVQAGAGPAGLTASEVIPMARTLLNQWMTRH